MCLGTILYRRHDYSHVLVTRRDETRRVACLRRTVIIDAELLSSALSLLKSTPYDRRRVGTEAEAFVSLVAA